MGTKSWTGSRRLVTGIFALILLLSALALSMETSRADGNGSPGSMEFVENKCNWLRENFPQSTEDIQAVGSVLAGVPADRITTHEYKCSKDGKVAVFDGFVVLGKFEGKGTSAVTLTVPKYGAIDGSQPSCGYTYTGDYSTVADLGEEGDDCEDTVRATSGKVTGNRLTYYPFYDLNPPPADYEFDPGVSAQSSSNGNGSDPGNQASASTDLLCVTGAELADERGWTVLDNQPASVTDYGGAQIQVPEDATGDLGLPDQWEATWDGPNLIGPDDSLLPGEYYSIYPPNTTECRVDTLDVLQ